jgi:hypothetical protein
VTSSLIKPVSVPVTYVVEMPRTPSLMTAPL